MREGICYVIGAGDFTGFSRKPQTGDFMIAADGGYTYLQQRGIEADLVLGDFDSISERPRHKNVIELPTEKDDTDMLYALRVGLKKGYQIFHLYGGMGGRFEHTLANLQSFAFLADKGARGYLFGHQDVTTVIKNAKIEFTADAEGFFSMFSFSERCTGVFIKGLKYELADAQICNSFPIGVSNEFTGKDSEIAVKEGMAAMVFGIKNMSCMKKGKGA